MHERKYAQTEAFCYEEMNGWRWEYNINFPEFKHHPYPHGEISHFQDWDLTMFLVPCAHKEQILPASSSSNSNSIYSRTALPRKVSIQNWPHEYPLSPGPVFPSSSCYPAPPPIHSLRKAGPSLLVGKKNFWLKHSVQVKQWQEVLTPSGKLFNFKSLKEQICISEISIDIFSWGLPSFGTLFKNWHFIMNKPSSK